VSVNRGWYEPKDHLRCVLKVSTNRDNFLSENGGLFSYAMVQRAAESILLLSCANALGSPPRQESQIGLTSSPAQ
jgi:hypothetical protein